ncbi:MAG TPA: CoA transferase, partial [Candidatus Ozemobacteraceae bacterium]|nr:CoA transferase [Candidatus Ozemobacteraceae bacterium]
EDAHVKARRMLVEMTHPVAGMIKVPGVPIKFSETAAEAVHPAPLLGQHNGEIWGQRLKRQVEQLKKDGVI